MLMPRAMPLMMPRAVDIFADATSSLRQIAAADLRERAMPPMMPLRAHDARAAAARTQR